jgi:predicted protein tyrosine phosphatase
MLIRSFHMVDPVMEAEPKRWNVISVCKHVPPKALCSHHCHVNCDDVNRSNLQDPRIRSQIAAGWLRPPTRQHVEMALRFAREHGTRDLLIHCREGVSRSPAIAWCILLDQLGSPERATQELFAIHPRCRPNDRIIQLGLEVSKRTDYELEEVLAGIDKLFVCPEDDSAP